MAPSHGAAESRKLARLNPPPEFARSFPSRPTFLSSAASASTAASSVTRRSSISLMSIAMSFRKIGVRGRVLLPALKASTLLRQPPIASDAAVAAANSVRQVRSIVLGLRCKSTLFRPGRALWLVPF